VTATCTATFDLPCLLAGKTRWDGFKTGQHLHYPDNTPMANLLLTILDKTGVHIDKLGDSTGRLEPDYFVDLTLRFTRCSLSPASPRMSCAMPPMLAPGAGGD